jgi:hypothetical protein
MHEASKVGGNNSAGPLVTGPLFSKLVRLRLPVEYPQQGNQTFSQCLLTNRLPQRSSFECGWRAGKEAERALIAQKLHKGFECLTAASFAIELAKKPDDQQTELVSRASKLLTEAIELLGGVLDGQKGKELRNRPGPEHSPSHTRPLKAE